MTKKELAYKAGKALRKLRHDQEVNQRVVAAGAEIDYAGYNRIENGIKHLSLDHVVKIAGYYKMPAGDLVNLIMAT